MSATHTSEQRNALTHLHAWRAAALDSQPPARQNEGEGLATPKPRTLAAFSSNTLLSCSDSFEPTAEFKHSQVRRSNRAIIRFRIRMQNPDLFRCSPVECAVQKLQNCFSIRFRHAFGQLAK